MGRWIALVCAMAAAAGTAACRDENRSAPERRAPDPDRAKQLVETGYTHKKEGRNAAALQAFIQAASLLDPASLDYASVLDDQASVYVRLGEYDRAEGLYRKALALAKKHEEGARLADGIARRLEIVGALRRRGIACKEPRAPQGPLPYFPDPSAIQQRLSDAASGAVTACSDAPTPFPLSLIVVLGGDGRLVHAYAKDAYRNSAVERCVVQHLESLVPTAQLPRFAACFRTFTFAVMVGGTRSEPQGANAEAVPEANRAKGTMPDADRAAASLAHLVRALNAGDPTQALPAFFPQEPFVRLKESRDPARYHRILTKRFIDDVAAAANRLGPGPWTLARWLPGSCRWKAPGTEANRIGYWSCYRNALELTNEAGTRRRIPVQAVINWGERWYVTHLAPAS